MMVLYKFPAVRLGQMKDLLLGKRVCVLQEYEGLTNKIHELQLREQELQEHLSSEDLPADSPLQQEDQLDPVDHEPQPPCLPPSFQGGNMDAADKGTMRNMVKAYLPNKQITTVSRTVIASESQVR